MVDRAVGHDVGDGVVWIGETGETCVGYVGRGYVQWVAFYLNVCN